MANDLTPDSEFTVKDSATINLIIAVFFYIMSGCTFYYNYGEKGFDSMAAVSLVPAIVCTIKVFFKPSIITINKKGIWFGRSPVTDWQNFINAATQQLELKVGGFTDRNILYVQYLRPGTDEKYKKTIQLGNTQNKSEEDIIAAIQYFYGLYLSRTGSVVNPDFRNMLQ